GLGVSTNTVTFANATAGSRVDTLLLNGVGAGDQFTVNGPGNAGAGTAQISKIQSPGVSVPETLLINTSSISSLDLVGVGANDTFNITGGLPYTSLAVHADATANLSGAVGPVTVNIADNTPGSANPNTVITGYGGQVTLIGVDTANLNTNA